MASEAKTQDQLLDELDKGYPPSWQPTKEGESLIGWLVRVERGQTKFGPSPLMVIRDDDGAEHSVWIFYPALASELRRTQPQAGERLAVRYEGVKPVKNPSPGKADTYHAYRIAVDRPEHEQVVDWGATLGPESGVAAGEPEPDDSDLPI